MKRKKKNDDGDDASYNALYKYSEANNTATTQLQQSKTTTSISWANAKSLGVAHETTREAHEEKGDVFRHLETKTSSS